jgi:hypothetical protein
MSYPLGLTIDEAVFTLGFTAADFAVLGETVTTMRRRGFDHSHVQQMQEPVFNFESALRATQAELETLSPPTEAVSPAAHTGQLSTPPTRPKLLPPTPKPKKKTTQPPKAFPK